MQPMFSIRNRALCTAFSLSSNITAATTAIAPVRMKSQTSVPMNPL